MGISLGLVGLGSFGGCFAPLFKSHPQVDRIALCDAEPSKLKYFAEREDFKDKVSERDLYDSFEGICDADVDALVIITQPWLHAPQCIYALEHGKHVYSAVPIISLPDSDETLDWCGKLIQTVRQTGMNYMLGETTIYRPQTMYCSRQAAHGEFGDFVFAEGEYAHDVDMSTCSLREVSRSRTNGKIGSQYSKIMESYLARGLKGSPMSYPTHSVSGPIAVMKTRARKVSASGFRNRTQDPFFANSHFSNVVALYHLANGACFRVAEMREVSDGVGCQGEDFRIFGTRGSYSDFIWSSNGRVTPDGSPKENKRTQLTGEGMRDPLPRDVADAFNQMLNKAAKPGDDFVPSGHGGSHPYLVHEFVTSVAEERMPAINIWDAAHYMAMGAAAHRSALLDGELVKVEDFGEAPCDGK